ncbi:alpha/beta fold hydrolase [Prescottella agglutinans]|uniref:Pimeloyl-ACP methyl ester carboxylesterase n=1 Tax=Prescottella agglutinans TaxID=1644129 RepID=A0ABT6M7T6_9NOCA|nr:alpha/beta fold hydrolase [Prescottella agglutinans]MDH6280367.1 pimeloyl-ACP methyl ester carboxylesterase [Prescottella agglutinans]
MQQAINPVDGVGIAYRVIGDGPPLVLAHGTALSSAIWRAFGYVKALRDEFQLILPDMRGHGRSDTPRDSASYAMDLVVGDILTVLDDLGHERAHYLGYSFGGRVGLSLAVTAPQRLRTLTVGGGSSRPQAGSFDKLFFPGCIDVLDREGMTAFLDQWNAHRTWPLDPATRAAFDANDTRALVAYLRRSEEEPGVPDAALAALDVPTMLFVGSEDGPRFSDTQKLAYLIPGSRLAVIPGFDHATTVAASAEVLAVVRPFLEEH